MTPAFFREPRGPFSRPVLAAALRHAAAEAPRESCGLVRAGEYLPCANVAQRPELEFDIDGAALSDAYRAGDLEGVIHSHPGGPWWPSAADMAGQVETGVPWAIVVPGGSEGGSEAVEGSLACAWGIPNPPLFAGGQHRGRAFLHGVADCYTLIRDWYAQERGVDLPEFAREWRWWEAPERWGSLYLEGLERAGFEVVTTDPTSMARQAQPGDVLLRRVLAKVPNHGAIYLGGGLLLEHTPFELSQRRPAGRALPVCSHLVRKVR